MMTITGITKMFRKYAKGGLRMSASIEFDQPRILIRSKPFQRLTRFIDLCPTEIVGLGKMRWLGTDIEIYDIFTLPQSADPASAHIEPDAVAECVTKMVENDEPTEDLSVWWHSHVKGSSWWSSIDTNMAETFRADVLVGILGNQQHEFTCRLDIYKPIRVRLTDLPLICPENDLIDEEVIAEIKQNVRKIHGW